MYGLIQAIPEMSASGEYEVVNGNRSRSGMCSPVYLRRTIAAILGSAFVISAFLVLGGRSSSLLPSRSAAGQKVIANSAAIEFFSGDDAIAAGATPGKPRSKNAFASLFFGDNAISAGVLLDLRVFYYNLRQNGFTSDYLVLIPEGDPAFKYRELLESEGFRVVAVPNIPLPRTIAYAKSRWPKVMSRLAVFNLVEYTQIAVFDTDMVVLNGSNPEGIFEACGDASMCLARERFWLGLYNAGVIVFRTSTQNFQKMKNFIEDAESDKTKVWKMGDMEIIGAMIKDMPEGMTFRALCPTWNSCAGPGVPKEDGTPFHLPKSDQVIGKFETGSISWKVGYVFIHFCGEPKPRDCMYCSNEGSVKPMGEGTLDPEDELRGGANGTYFSLNQVAWHAAYTTYENALNEVDACAVVRDGRTCSNRSGCRWCGSMCTNSNYPCSRCWHYGVSPLALLQQLVPHEGRCKANMSRYYVKPWPLEQANKETQRRA